MLPNILIFSHQCQGQKVTFIPIFQDGNKINSHALSKTLITNQIQGKLRISTLTIEKTDMDNAGIYVCRTTDKTNAEVAVRILNGKTGRETKPEFFTPDNHSYIMNGR